ncbi:MAG: hypothetical protein FWG27_09140 [Treponema sp.]|nr:hypothetical protein [Treponema sp.]
MKKIICCVIALFLFAGSFSLSAQTLSGNLDTKITLGAGDSTDFFYGAEEYANLRLKIPAGEYASIYSAFNFIAAAGTSGTVMAVSNIVTGAFAAGENYTAVMELERLYVQLSSDTLGLSAGLFRIPFGYSPVWRPMDFLNPGNPLEPDARLRGVLGIAASAFPEKLADTKFLVFATAPQNPFTVSGRGTRAGLSWESHWQRASAQFLYCFESPVSHCYPISGIPILTDEYPLGLHRAGLSIKAEMKPGLWAEFLYNLNPDLPAGIEGLAASAGADYSFFNGRLYVLLEYLYSGSKSADAVSAALPSGHTGSHYIYAAGTWKWNDFSAAALGCAANLEDISFTPFVSWEYEFIQGMIFFFRAHVPLDRDSFNAGNPGEFGPRNSGSYAFFNAGLRVKF